MYIYFVLGDIYLKLLKKLKIYGLYKLSTIGKCNVDEPSMFYWKRKEMWKAWKELGDKNIKNPHQMYVDYLPSIV